MAKIEQYYATGRRKTSVARTRVKPGTGQVIINRRPMAEYFGRAILSMIVRQPFEITGTMGKFDVSVNVRGGGISGQAGAIRHGISRALLDANPDFRPILKKAGFLSRDARKKERKKYGLRGARARYQYSKR